MLSPTACLNASSSSKYSTGVPLPTIVTYSPKPKVIAYCAASSVLGAVRSKSICSCVKKGAGSPGLRGV